MDHITIKQIVSTDEQSLQNGDLTQVVGKAVNCALSSHRTARAQPIIKCVLVTLTLSFSVKIQLDYWYPGLRHKSFCSDLQHV